MGAWKTLMDEFVPNIFRVWVFDREPESSRKSGTMRFIVSKHFLNRAGKFTMKSKRFSLEKAALSYAKKWAAKVASERGDER
jgi:hypothetical protein